MTNILQSPMLTDFLYPLLLVFFICYAILEKTKILGDGKQQLNAGVSLIVGLIFVGAIFPKLIVANLVQYMSIAMIIIFVGLVLWGFVSGQGEKGFAISDGENGLKINKIFAFLIFGSLVFVIFWITGFGDSILGFFNKLFGLMFGQGTGTFWSNALMIGVIFIAICTALNWNPFSAKGNSFWIKLK